MKIKAIEMSGFKSFVDRTVIQFEDGITGVVGPNGTGKSNIVDAIRWVMGEMSAKHLRGSEMQDVIFNGSEARPPTGMAQVFLTFDNSDGRAPAEYSSYSEIQVGRRLYRSGESEYFINKTPCRLKDIVDLFLGTGVGTKAYSIVEQGMVGAIVQARPEERRMLIEEAAGISKFKSRKEAALRKMESTRQNLARLADIQAELARQIGSLSRQAKKAERYRKLAGELKGRELNLAATRHRQMRLELESLEAEQGRLSEAHAAAQAALSGIEAEVEAARLSLAEAERELDGVQQDIYRAEHTIKLSEAQISHREREREAALKLSAALAEEMAALEGQQSEVAAKMEEANGAAALGDLTLAGAAGTAEAIERECDVLRDECARAQGEAEGIQGEAMARDRAAAAMAARIEGGELRLAGIRERVARNADESEALCGKGALALEGLADKERGLAEIRELKIKADGDLRAIEDALGKERLSLDEAKGRADAIRGELGEKRARLALLLDLRRNLEGYRDGVRALLARREIQEGFAGVVGTVGDLIETEAQFETALGAALGERLQYVVVRSREDGIEAIDYLRSQAQGRGSFIPFGVRVDGGEASAPTGEGVVGPMTDFVRFTDDHRKICQHLLGDVILVEDLSSALKLWEDGGCGKTFVTRDGTVVDPSGVVTGGSGAGAEGDLIAQRRLVKELESETARLADALALAEGEVRAASGRVADLEGRAEDLRHRAHEAELAFVRQGHDLEMIRGERARCEAQSAELSAEAASLAEELREVTREMDEAKAGLLAEAAARDEAALRLAPIQAEIEAILGRREAKERDLVDLRVELAKARERAEASQRELAQLLDAKVKAWLGIDRRAAEIKEAKVRLATLAREDEGFRAELGLAVRAVSQLKESQASLKVRYEEGAALIRERELNVRELRRSHDEALASSHGVDLKLTEHRGRMQRLAEAIGERYRLDLAGIEAEHSKEGLDVAEEEAAVSALKERLDGIGPVNVDAIKEFEELSERHGFIEGQSQDLAQSLENLSKAIARINRTSRERFRRAFEAVDGEFQTLFPKLFNGGQARLMLTDEENLLETGIEIVAQPPGKRLQSITLLSGGEKALTAVALVFAIFLVKPSPFCLLDEVDAPLDDANVDRFNDLIRSMTPHSQFILITHNKRSMELADLLYGVTMEEAGVSRMVSVKLGADAEREQAVA